MIKKIINKENLLVLPSDQDRKYNKQEAEKANKLLKPISKDDTTLKKKEEKKKTAKRWKIK